MLIQFKVKNYMSFRGEQVFSMVASDDDDNLSNTMLLTNNDDRLLKTTALYGANASGKTNFVRAVGTAIEMVRISNNRQSGEKLTQMVPFAFDDATTNEPCEFEFIFYANSNKYLYGFKADQNKVHEEYLYQYVLEKETLIFERSNCDKYNFLEEDSDKLNTIKDKNIDNKLFLATATTWNYDKTKDPYIWFAHTIDTYEGGTLIPNSVEPYRDNNLKTFLLKLLKSADIHVEDYVIKDYSKVLSKGNVWINPLSSITMIHKITNVNKEYELDFIAESSGTKVLFSMAPLLKEVFEEGGILVIDELERSLHPNLVKLIIQLFHNPDVNTGNAQLIFNTHDTSLLSLRLFRRDQIWFVEKNLPKCETCLYSLDDFEKKQSENIQKEYLNGRFGAVPFILDGEDLWLGE